MTSGRRLSLYLVRHAHAEPRGPRWPDDARRPVTVRGRSRFERVLADPAVRRRSIDLVLTSGFVRAAQTAAMLAEAQRIRPAVRVCRALEPGGRPEAVARAVARRSPVGSVALVGHEPDLSRLAAYLIGRPVPLAFRKGGVWLIQVRASAMAASGRWVWARWAGTRGIEVVTAS